MKTQQIANKFPSYAKMRRDPSSMGQRMFYRVGEILDDFHASAAQIKDSMRLFSRSMGVDAAYMTGLATADYITHTVNAGGGILPTYPTTVTGDAVALERVETFEELFYGAANQFNLVSTLSYTNRIVWDSGSPNTYNDIENPERIAIDIRNGKNYKSVGNYGPSNEAFFDGYHCVSVEGYDYNNNFFSEKISVIDDGVYYCTKPVSAITKVLINGFEANVTLYCLPGGLTRETDEFRSATTSENSGPLEYYLESDATYSYLVYSTKASLRGDRYRNQEEPIDDNERIIAKQALLNEAGSAIVAVDFSVSPHNTLIHVLDSSGDVHVYYPAVTPFTPPANVSRDSHLELRPLQHRVQYGSTERIATFFARPKFPIVSAQIKRVSPAGVTNYLQSNKTWSASSHFFSGNTGRLVTTILKSWDDFAFSNEYNELGEWKFYALVKTSTDLTTYATAVMVESNQALESIAVGKVGVGCYFSENGMFSIYDSSNIYQYDLWKAAYVAHFGQQQLWFNHAWTSITTDGSPYSLTWIDLPNVLDDIGVELSLPRNTQESLANYRRRLAGEAFGPDRTLSDGLYRSLTRHIGERELRVFDIDIIRDANNNPIAADPYIEITSTRLKAYNDHANNTVSVEVDFTNNTNGQFLADVVAAFSGNAYFTVDTKVDYNQYLVSTKLLVCNSSKYAEELIRKATVYKTAEPLIDDIWFSNAQVFVTEEADVNDVDADGKFNVNKTEGVITAYNNINSIVSYTYRKFPFDVYYVPVRGFEWDSDVKYLAYDQQISDATGTLEHTLLNPEGASLLAKVCELNPLQWGE